MHGIFTIFVVDSILVLVLMNFCGLNFSYSLDLVLNIILVLDLVLINE